MVNQSVSLCDRLEISPREGEADRIDLTGTYADRVPDDSGNLVRKALEACRRRNPALPRFTVVLRKEIPVGGGLGGGSADVAAVLHALERGGWMSLREAQWLEAAAELGADVPFAWRGGTAIVEGLGEKIRPIEFPFPEVCYVLVSPEVSVSTAWAYGRWDECERVEIRQLMEILTCLKNKDYDSLCKAVYNGFERMIFEKHPGLCDLAGEMRRRGCDAAWMTGSGSNLVGLCQTADQARRASKSLSGKGFRARVVKPGTEA